MKDREQRLISSLSGSKTPSLFVAGGVSYYVFSTNRGVVISDNNRTYPLSLRSKVFNATNALNDWYEIEHNKFWLWYIINNTAYINEYDISNFNINKPKHIASKSLGDNATHIYGNIIEGFNPICGILSNDTLTIETYTNPISSPPNSVNTLDWDVRFSKDFSISRDISNNVFNITNTIRGSL